MYDNKMRTPHTNNWLDDLINENKDNDKLKKLQAKERNLESKIKAMKRFMDNSLK